MRSSRRSGIGQCVAAFARRVCGRGAPAHDSGACGPTALIRYARALYRLVQAPDLFHRGGAAVSTLGFDGSIGLNWRRSSAAGRLVDTHATGGGRDTGADDEAGTTTRERDESMFAIIEAIS